MIDRPHMRKNMLSLSFWTWLTLLNMLSTNSIHFTFKPDGWIKHHCVCVCITFFNLFISCRTSWVVSITWLFWTVLQYSSVHKCLYCIAQEWYHWIICQFYF
jgi:hypothetical protein